MPPIAAPEFGPDVGSAAQVLFAASGMLSRDATVRAQVALDQQRLDMESRRDTFAQALAEQEQTNQRRRDEERMLIEGMKTAADMAARQAQLDEAAFRLQQLKEEAAKQKETYDARKKLEPLVSSAYIAGQQGDMLGAVLTSKEIAATGGFMRLNENEQKMVSDLMTSAGRTELWDGNVQQMLSRASMLPAMDKDRVVALAQLAAASSDKSQVQLRASLGVTDAEWAQVMAKSKVYSPGTLKKLAEFDAGEGATIKSMIAASYAEDPSGGKAEELSLTLRRRRMASAGMQLANDPQYGGLSNEAMEVYFGKLRDGFEKSFSAASDKGRPDYAAEGPMGVNERLAEDRRTTGQEVYPPAYPERISFLDKRRAQRQTSLKQDMISRLDADFQNVRGLKAAVESGNTQVHPQQLESMLLSLGRVAGLSLVMNGVLKNGVPALDMTTGAALVDKQELDLYMRRYNRDNGTGLTARPQAPRPQESFTSPGLPAGAAMTSYRDASGALMVLQADGTFAPAAAK